MLFSVIQHSLVILFYFANASCMIFFDFLLMCSLQYFENNSLNVYVKCTAAANFQTFNTKKKIYNTQPIGACSAVLLPSLSQFISHSFVDNFSHFFHSNSSLFAFVVVTFFWCDKRSQFYTIHSFSLLFAFVTSLHTNFNQHLNRTPSPINLPATSDFIEHASQEIERPDTNS